MSDLEICHVHAFDDINIKRARCYYAALSRYEVKNKVSDVIISGRNIPVRPPEKNGLKTLVQICIESLDSSYENMGSMLLPDKKHWDKQVLQIPTPVEQNMLPCIVIRK